MASSVSPHPSAKPSNGWFVEAGGGGIGILEPALNNESSSEESSSERADQAMARYAQGDEGSFEDIYDELAPRLHRLLLRMTQVAVAEDLLQQTFLQLHHHRGAFRPGAQVVPWAFAIARRLAIDWLRRQRLEDGAMARREAKEVADALCSHALTEARQLAAQLVGVFLGLPEGQRTAYVLVKQDGLSLAEAGQALGVTVTAIKLRLHRATVALRAALEARKRE
jgi:RNA polymerase sigma-70 factor, ECF subfamily